MEAAQGKVRHSHSLVFGLQIMQQEKSMPFGDHSGSPELNNAIMLSVVAVVTSSISEVADASAARCMA